MLKYVEYTGRGIVKSLDESGYAASLLGESLFWTMFGRRWRQTVRISQIAAQMMEIGINALPIATLLSVTIGVMLGVQSIYSLGLFGAESFAHVGIALALTREFSPLIMGILVAGRSGSALAAKLSSMTINQEVDALRAIGINPVRFLVAPALIAMLIMLPALTMWSNLVGLGSAGLFVSYEIDISLTAYAVNTIEVLSANDVLSGLGKSVVFAVLIIIVAAVNGSLVTGGSEGVGRMTTRAVVHILAAIVCTDMIFGFLVTQ